MRGRNARGETFLLVFSVNMAAKGSEQAGGAKQTKQGDLPKKGSKAKTAKAPTAARARDVDIRARRTLKQRFSDYSDDAIFVHLYLLLTTSRFLACIHKARGPLEICRCV